jgi:hypothetical protein
MMRSRHWRAAAILAPAGIMAAMFAGAAPAMASTSPTWHLVDEFTAKPGCNVPSGGEDALEVDLSGTWSSPITYSASGLPPGGTWFDEIRVHKGYRILGGTDISPGSSTGNGVVINSPTQSEEAWLVVVLPDQALGSTVTITLSATDGTTTETESIPVLTQSLCPGD